MKITIVGGGSYCWTPTLFRDIVCTPGLEGSEIVLEDINPRHLADLHACCKAVLAGFGKEKQFKLSATCDETRALRGADYVILTISTGGYDAMAHDLRIPYRYGIYQPVGDTVGPGGLSRALRNIPVVANIARRMESVCPNAWLLNITNPMTTLTRAVWRETDIRCIGLCHEVYGTLKRLGKILGGKDVYEDFDYVVAGVNHLPWLLTLKFRGRNAFPMLLRRIDKDGKVREQGGGPGTAFDESFRGKLRVKFALLKDFGALPAAGDRHVVEFFPYFCTREMRKGAAMGVELTTIETRRNEYTPMWKKNVADITSGKVKMEPTISAEATARVIAALAGVRDWKDVVNLPNRGQIKELPPEVVVETCGAISRNRAVGLPVERIPPAILAQIQRHVAVQEMTVEAAMKGDRNLALQALLNDPLCGIIPDYRNVAKMLDEMLSANRKWLPQFSKARARARS